MTLNEKQLCKLILLSIKDWDAFQISMRHYMSGGQS